MTRGALGISGIPKVVTTEWLLLVTLGVLAFLSLALGVMGLTFFVLAAVEVTIAKTKPDALFFAACVLGIGYGLRAYSHKLSGLKTVTVSSGVAAMAASAWEAG